MSNITQGVDVTDVENFKRIIPSVILTTYNTIPAEFFEMTDEELAKLAKSDVIMERLRISFWLEHDRAVRTNTPMSLHNTLSGVCSKQHFLKNICINGAKVAYLCRPPLNIVVAANESLIIAIEQMRAILTLPNFNAKGQLNSSLINTKLNVYKELYNRVRGVVVQKMQVDQRTLSLNMNQNIDHAPTPTLDEIDNRIKQLESGLGVDVSELVQIESDLHGKKE